MAANTQARMQFSLQDERGFQTSLSMPMFVDSAQTIAQAKTAWNAQAALLDLVTGAKILYGSVAVELAGSGMTFTPKSPTPAVDSRINEVGNFDFGISGVRYVYDSIVPALADGVLNSGGKTINEANTNMAAYIAAITAAVLGGNFTNHTFQVLTALVDSFPSDRKRRRVSHARGITFP